MNERRRDRFELKTHAEWCDELRVLCTRLNAAGFTPPWTPRALREYVNRRFDVLLGLDALTFDELRDVRDALKLKLWTMEAEAHAARSLSTGTARHALSRHAEAEDSTA
ncbi:MAG TPA: hypothetical protein VHU19_14405 [Pyrinomonadaceae bacterium]|jgi:hypothetical protein|nr:hypothetical protein [Pyrinomonadaceae bacterium]